MTQKFPSGFAQAEGVIGRPLQICEIDFEENAVKVCEDNLTQIQQNLTKLSEQLKLSDPDELRVCVISVMGMYRTGKSFLLDLLMRYLKTQGNITKFDPRAQWRMAENTYDVESFSWLVGEHVHKSSSGDALNNSNTSSSYAAGNAGKGDLDKVRISEGQNHDNERGFHWRSGIEKCTKGIWLWSKPFFIEQEVAVTGVDNNETTKTQPLAVLVMDTQGAWDSQMSSDHSACIFGITSLLSSKLIYNLQNRISEEKIDNLDYFTTFANLVVQEARENKMRVQRELKRASEGKKKVGNNPNLSDNLDDDDEDLDEEEDDGLGDLHFLVRDWEYFEDGWSLEQCTQQVTDHLMTHLDPGAVVVEERRATVDRLHNLFRSVNLCCLPHPGKMIPKPNWRGGVGDLDADFLYLLTHFLANLSHGEHPLKVTSPFGQELSASNFTRVVGELVSAFQSAKPNAVSLRQAFCNCESWRAKEEAIKNFDAEIEQALLSSGSGLREPSDVEQVIEEAKARHLQAFQCRIKALFGNDNNTGSEEERAKEEMLEAVFF